MAEETIVVEKPQSCKIAINAKGQYSGEVKVYANDSQDAIDVAKGHAEELAEWMKEKNGLTKPEAK